MEISNIKALHLLEVAFTMQNKSIEYIFSQLGEDITNKEQIDLERFLVKNGLVNFINHSYKGSYFELNQYGKGLSLLLLKENNASQLN